MRIVTISRRSGWTRCPRPDAVPVNGGPALPRPRLILLALAIGLCVGIPALASDEPGVTHARRATTPLAGLTGTWLWRDNDELLANASNSGTARFRTSRSGRVRVRFGSGRWHRVRWSARTRIVRFVAARVVGPRGGGRAGRVRYVGRLRRVDSTWQLEGTLRVLAPKGVKGASSFTASRR